MNKYQKIGEYLIDKGVLTPAQRDQALAEMIVRNRRFGEIVVDLGFATEDDVTEGLAKQFDLPFVDLETLYPSSQALRVTSPAFAVQRLILPVHIDKASVHCVVGDPLDIDLTDLLTELTGKRLNLAISAPTALKEKIIDVYRVINDPSRPAFSFGNR